MSRCGKFRRPLGRRGRSCAARWSCAGAGRLSGCGGSSSGDELEFTGSGYPSIDLANTRQVSGPIDSSNVGRTGRSLDTAVDGAEHLRQLRLDADDQQRRHLLPGPRVQRRRRSPSTAAKCSGNKCYEDPSHGPNGVVVADGTVFGATASEAFALDQETGKEVWSVPLAEEAEREHRHGARLPRRHGLRLDRAGHRRRQTYGAGAVGVLWALDGKTGKKVVALQHRAERASGATREVNSGGGLWYPPSFDEQGLHVLRHRQPGAAPRHPRRPWGSSRPGANLYTDSMVKLDAKTGKMQWYYQQTPHDIYDWDFQDPPILVSAGGRSWRSAPASRGSSSLSTRRPASPSGSARSASTTATTTTACWRCAANTRRSRPARSSPA